MDTKELISYFISLKSNLPFKRLGKTFKTVKNKYFYNVGTGKVLQCEEDVFKVLKQLEEKDTLDYESLNLLEPQFLDALKILANAVEEGVL